MEIEVIQTEDKWLAIRSDWDRLAGGNPMLSLDWLRGWWIAYGQGSKLYIVVVRGESQEIVGIAPWYQCDRHLSPSLRFLGSGKVCSDYLRVMSDANCQSDVCQAIVAHTNQRFTKRGSNSLSSGLYLEGFREDDLAMAELISSFQQSGFLAKTSKLESCWQISLPDSWEAMLLKLKKNFRRKARKCLDRLNDGLIISHNVTSTEDWPEVLEILERLHQARRTSMGESGCFDDPHFKLFLNHAIPPMMAQGKARVSWIESEREPIAIQIQLLGKDFVGMYQSGIDPNARALEPGHVIIAHAIRQAIEAGFKSYDFLRGDEHYKSAWGAQQVGLMKTWLIPPTIWARSVYYAGEGALALRAAYRQLRKPSQQDSAGTSQESDADLQTAAQNGD